jgi:3-phenylpropionate/cinnamic acid dioxygenase small subunit
MTPADLHPAAVPSPSTKSGPAVENPLLLRLAIEDFLIHEAALLDEGRFHEWYELLTDDLEYWMPVRTTRARGEEDREFARIGEGAFFDETKELIHERIRKLDTGYSWSEDPPSRTRHFVSNVRILETLPDGDVKVGLNFIVYRGRLASEEDFWVGRREDTLRPAGDGWRIAKRHIFIDKVSLTSKNLSVFF